MNASETAQETIDRMYHEGRSLVAIVEAVGTDDATIRLIGYRLGLSTKPGTKLDYARREVEGRQS